MHNLYFVAINREELGNESAGNIIEEANAQLYKNQFVSSKGGYFNHAKANWFLVGGRWSSYLKNLLNKKDFHKEAKEKILKLDKNSFEISTKDIKAHEDELNTLWKKLGGEYENPYSRDTYAREGYNDDAQLLTAKLFEKLKESSENVEVFFPTEYEEKTIKEVSKDCIEKYYLVVIDYHC